MAERETDERQEPTRQAWKACAHWLHYCVQIGWRKSDLDFLEALWWKHHDNYGRLKH